ncbi:MAG: hypothetical protein HKP48_09010 [Winogradskyella sp.]|uniref:hypothetical protein n=1 Tax=Winogradskyella sp. TaxID=1883156 RepID=UPI00183F88E2|nr:hypothetical protein [Winogradskyella sp.]MBT8243802.1 hypothetical protein [Winogradskyella sp.]NNK23410.1 hypothetical protein [Winogradskyella sp.]
MQFTYKQLHKICKTVVEIKDTITANKILDNNTTEADWVVFKHDVETNVSRALKMARIEAQYGITATYYVQGYLLKDNVALLKEIAKLGHEVTYHYDVLDANNGDYIKAREEFVDFVNAFEVNGFNIETLCPHGNPLMIRNGWNSNKDFFRNDEISKEFSHMLDIVVDLPKTLVSEYKYISDAGFKFQIIANVEDNDINNGEDIHIKSLENFVEILKENKKVIFSTHPHRWKTCSISAVINKSKFKFIRSVALLVSKNKAIKKFLSKFYFLAKKI